MERPISENSGLCATCDNAPTCMYGGDAERPVMYCEEFTQHGTTPGGRTVPESPEAPGEEAQRLLVEDLCTRCASRATCTLPRPRGGVWQCDAFR